MNGVSAVVRLAGSADRFLVVTFPLPTAAALATRMLPALVETQQLDEGLIGDCVGEIGNVIAGQAKALLAETRHRFAMSLPEIVVGANHELLAKSSLQCLLVPFTSDLGEFTVQLIAEA
jgi:chemotaxis protein CheX